MVIEHAERFGLAQLTSFAAALPRPAKIPLTILVAPFV